MAACLTFLSTANLLAADTPPRCAAAGNVQSISLTDWEAGLGPWSADTYDVFRPETFDTPDWDVVGSLPDDRPGMAAFVANVDLGDCAADDESGVLTLTSPTIAIPSDAKGPKISFEHWFDIEYGWDGGNLKISVNNGEFNLVPTSAFELGPYTDTLFEAYDEFGLEVNTNPLAEQEAFTGPEGEEVTGIWSESRINLLGIADPGDTIQLRFDFGVDACFGKIGWYVDDVEVYSCDGEQPTNATLTLVKEVVNDNGGTAAPSSWTLAASGPTPFSGPGPIVSSSTQLAAGTYDLSENGGPPGYDASAWTCVGGNQIDDDTITLAVGDDATCTITNDDIGPTLKLVKTIVNDNGGSVTDPNDFGLRIDGNLVSHNTNYILTAGDHDVSEDGLPGYIGGDWGGDCEVDGSITLQLGQVAACTITNDDLETGFQINAGHSGAWWNPDTDGQGVLIDIAPSEEYMFIAWFTYTDAESDNPFEHRWLSAQGNYSGGTAHLLLHETLGGQFDDPQPVQIEAIGEVTLNFFDCETAEMIYRIHQVNDEDIQGTIPLTRAIPGSDDVCQQQDGNTVQAMDINAGMDGAWFEEATSGQGFLFDANPNEDGGNFIFVAWFTYGNDTASGQRWLSAGGNFEGPTAEMDITETTGGSFDDPLPPSRETVGTMRIDFEDCSNATLTYSLPGEGLEGEIPMTRALPGAEALCEEIVGGE